ncbi:MAG: metallophosphoesterase [Acidimicrobiia bacterium]|nr:metallophosphoesterase [Acidimicrobiia bacterium]
MAEYDVIGDVHGCLHTLRHLLSELGYAGDGSHPAGRRLAFVGDLVNRGLHSE